MSASRDAAPLFSDRAPGASQRGARGPTEHRRPPAEAAPTRDRHSRGGSSTQLAAEEGARAPPRWWGGPLRQSMPLYAFSWRSTSLGLVPLFFCQSCGFCFFSSCDGSFYSAVGRAVNLCPLEYEVTVPCAVAASRAIVWFVLSVCGQRLHSDFRGVSIWLAVSRGCPFMAI